VARNTPPVCKFCRREGLKLFLKGVRCETAKCPIEREWRNKPPGMHAWRRSKASEYGVRLREKQKLKRYYGLLEAQFQKLFAAAERSQENTGTALLRLLERRLDNVVFKSGLGGSRRTARQAVAHGHILVNGRKVDRPSYLVSVGDKITVRSSERSQKYVRGQLGEQPPDPPSWLVVNPNVPEVIVAALPTREDVKLPVQEQLIVEFCSR
jgi:small subunit ribosomal protein S4